MWKRLANIGKRMLQNKQVLLKIAAVYKLQRWARKYLRKKIRAQKLRTRALASIKIQSVWRGFWARSQIELRFTYGEAIFLSAVCKNLRQSHFILKMYRPCGIVCPQRKDKK